MPGFLSALRAALHPARRAVERKVVLSDYYNVLSAAGIYTQHRAKPWPIDRAVCEAYERTIYVFKAVEAIASNQARLPFKLKQGEQEVDDHPLYHVLNRRANPLETGPQFRKRLSAQVLLSKRGAFVEVTQSRGGTVKRLDLLPPGRTIPIPTDGSDPERLIDHYDVLCADGTIRRLDAEHVRWIRDPHPLDPWSGVTPLEAAGLSVELDVFTRLYNVQFLKNDSRPGGVLAVDGEMDPEAVEELEEDFGRGPLEAGKLSVITGKVSYVDLSTRPRDMSYQVTAQNAKIEILMAFGVPESVLGFAANRTYANAEQEQLNFWHITMPPHLALITTGFDEDSEDEFEPFFDVTGVPVLQAAEAKRREEARKEWEDGLISADEYREIAGYKVIGNPQTRALWIPAGKTPIPTRKADAAAFGLGADGQPLPVDNQAAPGALPPAPTPPQLPPGQSQNAQPPGAPGQGGQGQGGGAVPTAQAVQDDLLAGVKARLVLVRPAPSPALETKAGDRPGAESVPDQAAFDRLENAVAAALTALGARLIERAVARLVSPKTRKGTRHWQPATDVKQTDTRSGDTAVDAARVVDVQRWQGEAEATATPIVQAAAVAAAAALLADLGGGTAELGPVVAAAVGETLTLIGASAATQAHKLVALIATADGDGEPIDAIVATVRAYGGHLPSWAAAVAVQAADAAIFGARDAAAGSLVLADPRTHVERQWLTRKDERVRPTHRRADRQIQALGSPFAVGLALLRYPGDPLGPPEETCRCRCRVVHRAVATGKFVPTPVGEVTRRAG